MDRTKIIILCIFLIFLIPYVSAEIINERSSQIQNRDSYTLTTWEHKRWHNYSGTWLNYRNATNISEDGTITKTINQNYADGTQINITPFVYYNEEILDLNSVSSLTRNLLDLQIDYGKTDYDSKFLAEINVITGLGRVGYKIQSNKNLSYINEFYSRQEITKIIVDNMYEISYKDLVDSGYTTSYDSDNDIIWVISSSLSGRIVLDPVVTYYSDSQDGHCGEEVGGSCLSCVSGSTPAILGKWYPLGGFNTRYVGFLSFNTSGLNTLGVTPSDITDVKVGVYSQSYTNQFNCGGGAGSTNVRYDYYHNYIGSSLTCSDFSGLWTSGKNTNWGTSTGWKINSPVIASINISGDSDYRLVSGWNDCTGARQRRTHQWRTSEYSGTSFDPYINITYSLSNPYFNILKNQTNPTTPFLSNNTNIFVEVNITDLTINYTNFTILSPNSSVIIDNVNGTVTPNGTATLQNWTSDNFTIDYIGTWFWNYTLLLSNGSSFNDYGNFTINATSPPNITLINPINNTEVTEENINFQYNVTGITNISYCYLNLSGNIYNNTNITLGSIQSELITPKVDKYAWYVFCLDNYNQTTYSDIFNLTIISSSGFREIITKKYIITGLIFSLLIILLLLLLIVYFSGKAPKKEIIIK